MRKRTTEEYKKELEGRNIECLEEYINSYTKILHKCLICNYEWKAIPNNILNGRNCPTCAKVGQTKTTKEYKKEIENRNIECLEEYKSAFTKILHRCLICNYEWKATPTNILRGNSCPNCAKTKQTKTTEEYKKEIENRNIECLEEYINNSTKILHKCLKCGNTWKAAPNSILGGSNCPACAGNKKKTTEEYKEELKDINPNIICLEEYINNSTKILHKCLKCGNTWKAKPNNILHGTNCPVCFGTPKKTTEEYKTKLKDINPNIICLEEYKTGKTKIFHKCLICGNTWAAIPNSILNGNGCPHCKFSHGEKAVEAFLAENKINYIPQKRFSDCRDKRSLSFDFYLPELNIAIEYNGRQHYESIEAFGGEKQLHLQRHHDWLKRKYCRDKGITLITISYDEDVEKILLEKKQLIAYNINRKGEEKIV